MPMGIWKEIYLEFFMEGKIEATLISTFKLNY